MTTLIFGARGFIGRRLTPLLREQGEDVVEVGTTPFTPSGTDETIRSATCDLRRFDQVVELMLRTRPERVINLAYNLGNDHPPHEALQLNVVGMDNFFEASRLAGVEHVVFASSLAANGLQSNFGERAVTEEDQLLGSTYQYATHKVFNEWQADDFRAKYGMRITSIRPANVAGHDKVIGSVDHVQCIVGPALGRAVKFPYADAMRSSVHVDDVAAAFARITCATPQHVAYNTGGNTTSLAELADVVRSFIPDADIAFAAESGARAGSTNFLIDNSRLRSEFGITPMGLREMALKIANDARAEHGLPPIIEN
jgi:nucleoside-diphosphate-sugar epimerase